MGSSPFLILISGLPCTGKTTLAERISDCLSFTLITKDAIKEILFDHLGYGGRDWSKCLSLATYDLMFHTAAASLKAGGSVVVEANFSPDIIRRGLEVIRQQSDFCLCDIHCRTDGEILLERFKKRACGGTRNPGHLDTIVLSELEAMVTGGDEGRLDLDCETIQVDTTQLERLDMDAILTMIKQIVENKGYEYG
jgi:predicted kinase